MATKQSGHKLGDQTSLPGQMNRTEKMERPKQQEPQRLEIMDVEKGYMGSSETKDTETNDHPVAGLVPQSNLQENVNAQPTMPCTHYDHKDDDDLFLAQADPIDMDLCSQLETDIHVGKPQHMCSSSAVDHSTSVPQQMDVSKCRFQDCTEFVTVSGDKCPIHSAAEKKEDHMFARPGLPPSLQKLSRPSTAKVYSSGTTSRTASLTKDLESLPKHLPTAKAKSQSLKPSVPRPTVQPPAQNKTPVYPSTSNVLKPLINQNNIPIQCSSKSVQGTRMNHAAIRTPQLPLLKVPLRFSDYEEYFSVFCPLMLLNTFESVRDFVFFIQ
ncbi:probable helicase senataxin [Rana temporaria]|uniref:probable helicase senataxin n=1 Tax=Rana temporaria TaxID=8407 RepID=UPI001AAD1E03|nr:probable helicase senataxin [Rana temporaria]